MRIALVLTPLSDHNLRLASQTGVTDIVIRYPGQDLEELRRLKARVETFGMNVPVIEGYLPIEAIKLGLQGRDLEIKQIKQLITNMGSVGIPLPCYNFMAGSDWSRTSFQEKDRGGALVSGFDINQVPPTESGGTRYELTPNQLWENLRYFLERVLPVAEKAGVTLAMHPDDPPLPSLNGFPRIMYSVENFEKLVDLVRSPANAICFCQGTFAEMGEDIVSAIRRLSSHIRYVHFRDVRGNATKFVETFHDNGPASMVGAMRAYHEIGYRGVMRPDHVPQLAGEEDGEPGYTMLGRLFAVGYMRGLIQAVTES